MIIHSRKPSSAVRPALKHVKEEPKVEKKIIKREKKKSIKEEVILPVDEIKKEEESVLPLVEEALASVEE